MAKPKAVAVAEGLKLLRLFNEKAERLRRTRFVQMTSGERVGVRVSFHADKPLTVEKRGADEEATAALVLTLRFFLQPRDRIQLEQIERLYHALPLPDDLTGRVTRGLKRLNTAIDRATPIAFNGQPITGRMLLDTFMYGNHAHANDDKRAIYEDWRSGPQGLVLESYFEWVVGEVLRYVFWLERVNKKAIELLEGNIA
jgi:hypothetical protein